MTREEILAKLADLIKDYLEVQLPEQVTEEHRLFDDLLIDSIMVLQLVVYMEDEFNVNIPEENVDPAVFLTMGSLVSFVRQLQAESQVI